MQSILLTAVLALASSSAFASNLACRDVNAGPDHGYYISFSKNLKGAVVSMQSIAGPREVAKLKCAKPDQRGDLTEIICTQPGLADAGYMVIVQSGGFTGATSAILQSISFAGANHIADFRCR